MQYWLFKTEPSSFSWDDLKSSPGKKTTWDGVRNYQARNFFKEMKKGDLIFFYHSVKAPMAIMGVAEVCRDAYPDHTQFEPKSKYFDAGSSPDNPRWLMVDVKYLRDFEPPVTRDELKGLPGLEEMVLLQKGSRLSIQPVTANEWKIITALRPNPPK